MLSLSKRSKPLPSEIDAQSVEKLAREFPLEVPGYGRLYVHPEGMSVEIDSGVYLRRPYPDAPESEWTYGRDMLRIDGDNWIVRATYQMLNADGDYGLYKLDVYKLARRPFALSGQYLAIKHAPESVRQELEAALEEAGQAWIAEHHELLSEQIGQAAMIGQERRRQQLKSQLSNLDQQEEALAERRSRLEQELASFERE